MQEFIDITDKHKKAYNTQVYHPLQSFEWGEFRKKTGVQVVRRGILKSGKIQDGFTLTIHKIPKTPFTIGYFPKGGLPTPQILAELKKVGKSYNCIFIQLEPNITVADGQGNFDKLVATQMLRPAFRPLFTKYSFILDITKSETELLRIMHPKTRYNIKVAQKKGVWIEEDNSEQGFLDYLHLTEETTRRQKFYAHTAQYHKSQWETLPKSTEIKELSYHLFHARYKAEDTTIHTLTSWVLFTFGTILYYPYGASSTQFRHTMSSNLMMWEAIRYGKKLGLKSFDMWGALGPNPDPKDPWFGFHKFKLGYGATLTEFVGSYNVVTNPQLYNFFAFADSIRWMLLRLRRGVV
jgi:lipid II:glycine glycyltransferase (peptidoglycan interpeptide bridge formation enzyme)